MPLHHRFGKRPNAGNMALAGLSITVSKALPLLCRVRACFNNRVESVLKSPLTSLSVLNARSARRRALQRRLRSASSRPTVAEEFRLASLAVATCFLVILVAQLAHAYARSEDRQQLAAARSREDVAHLLDGASGEFRLAAVDLINDSNAGHDAEFRNREMQHAAVEIRSYYGLLWALSDKRADIAAPDKVLRKLDDAVAIVESINAQTSTAQREEDEDAIEDFGALLEQAIASEEKSAVLARQLSAEMLRQNDVWASVLIVSVIAIAFSLGLYFYRRLARGVFPAANFMRQAIVRMANGHLDIQLPDQHFTEPQQMIHALRKMRATARREQQYAMIDFLTDLPNRRALAAALARWSAGSTGTMFVVDIDGFKQVNDNFGHPVGDELVRQTAARLIGLAPDTAMVARLGGDEFAVLVPGLTKHDAAGLAGQIVSSCAEPVSVMRNRLTVTVSVGVTDVAVAADRPAELSDTLRFADFALYAAKANGRNGYAVYSPDMLIASDLIQLIEIDLDAAIAGGGLDLVFQPIVAVDGSEHEVETLLRWNHPTLGPVSPEQLIAVAERSGQMERLGQWITETAMSVLTSWPNLSLSLNLSPRQLRSPNFVVNLTAQCRQHGIAPHRIILEITESVAVDDIDSALLKLRLLQSIGFRVALDDFGKGYSSLWMLKQFAFDRIKIDRSLVEDIEHDAPARAVLVAAVNIGRQLGMEVVAEGVGTREMADELAEIGCTHLQGYLISYPLERHAVPDFYADSDVQLRAAG
jgi:diguanylate cyclase (GGDEF)-like protein